MIKNSAAAAISLGIIALMLLGVAHASISVELGDFCGYDVYTESSNLQLSSEECGYQIEQPWLSVKKTLRRSGASTFGQCFNFTQVFFRQLDAELESSLASTSSSPDTVDAITKRAADAVAMEFRTSADRGKACCSLGRDEDSLYDEVTCTAAPTPHVPDLWDLDSGDIALQSDMEETTQAVCAALEETALVIFAFSNASSASWLDLLPILPTLACLESNITALSSADADNASFYLVQCSKDSTWCFNLAEFSTKVDDLTVAVANAENNFSLSTLTSFYETHQQFEQTVSLFWQNASRELREAQAEQVFTVCNYLYPACTGLHNKSLPIPTCSSTCQQKQALVLVVRQLTTSSQAQDKAVAEQIQDIVTNTCNGRRGDLCVEVDYSSLVANGSRAGARRTLIEPKDLDLASLEAPRFECPYPFRETNITSHHLESVHNFVRETIRSRYGINLDNGVIARLFPCGAQCVTYGYSDTAQERVRAVVALCSWLVFITSILSCIVFLSLPSIRKQLHRQLVFAFNVSFIIWALGSLPATFTSSRRFYCFPEDDTLRINEPKTSFLCSLFGSFVFAGTLNTSFLLACLSHQWLVIIKHLGQISFAKANPKKDRRWLTFYMLVSILPTIGLTAAILQKRKVEGTPILGTCSVTLSSVFYYLTIPVTIGASLAIILLSVGFVQLYHIRRSAAGNAQQLTNSDTRLGSESQSQILHPCFTDLAEAKPTKSHRRSTDALSRLVLNVLIYIISVLVMAVVNIVFGGLAFSRESKVREDVYRSVVCRGLISLSRGTHCPSVPVIHEFGVMSLAIVLGLASLIMSSWILSTDVRNELLKKLKKNQKDRKK